MKQLIKYHLTQAVNVGTDDSPVWQQVQGAAVVLDYSEKNLEIAQEEAWQGVLTVDELPAEEEEQPKSLESRVSVLENQNAETREMLDILLTGATSDE